MVFFLQNLIVTSLNLVSRIPFSKTECNYAVRLSTWKTLCQYHVHNRNILAKFTELFFSKYLRYKLHTLTFGHKYSCELSVYFQKNILIICDFIYIFKMSLFLAHPMAISQFLYQNLL